MMKCCICDNNISLFSSKCANGAICSDCRKKIPRIINISKYNDYTLNHIIDYELSLPTFSQTSHLGCFGLDEVNRMIRVDDVIFKLVDIEKISLICKNPYADKYNYVYTDIELYAKVSSPSIEFNRVISKHIKCNSEIKGDQIEWKEPSMVSMMRNLINTSYRLALEDYIDNRIKIEDDVKFAEKLFMLSRGYDEAELKQRRNQYMKIFHPDEGGDDVATQIINNSYHLLLERIKNSEVS